MFKNKAVRGVPPPAGLPLPKVLRDTFVPTTDTGFDEGLSSLRQQIARTETGGERFTARSPIFGEFTHDEWTRVQLGHCTLHLGYLWLK